MSAYRGVGVCVAVVLLAGGLALADDAAKEQKALQGTWEVTGVTDNGKQVPDDRIKGVRFIFAEDTMTMTMPKSEDVKFTIKLDPAKKPRTIDLTHKGKTTTTTPGIYELEGDTLKLALPPRTEKDRPTKFESKEGSRISVVVLKRAKKGS